MHEELYIYYVIFVNLFDIIILLSIVKSYFIIFHIYIHIIFSLDPARRRTLPCHSTYPTSSQLLEQSHFGSAGRSLGSFLGTDVTRCHTMSHLGVLGQ